MRRKSTHPGSAVIGLATLVASILILANTNVRAEDSERGRLLYENECKVCHTSVVHVREDRKAKSRDEIRNWVQRWQKELKLQWGSSEIDDVIEYLDTTYYKLKSAS